jgi:hypothetical protein
MKITRQHHKQMPYLKRLTNKLTTEQMAVLETLLEAVYQEGKSAGYQIGNPNSDVDD